MHCIQRSTSSNITMLSESQYVWRRDRSSGNHDNDFVVGIDFGTTNSCVALWNPYKKRAKVIKNLNGSRLTRSTIKFDEDFDHPVVGVTEITELYSTHVISRIKLLLGSINQTQVQCNNAKGDSCDVSVDKLCSFILNYVRKYAEAYIVKNLKKLQQPLILSSNSGNIKSETTSNRQLPLKAAVIGIPVSFGTSQVNALHEAALSAGFEKVSVLSIGWRVNFVLQTAIYCAAITLEVSHYFLHNIVNNKHAYYTYRSILCQNLLPPP